MSREAGPLGRLLFAIAMNSLRSSMERLGRMLLIIVAESTIVAPTGFEKKYLPSEGAVARAFFLLKGHPNIVGLFRRAVIGSPHFAQTSLPPMLLSKRV